MNEYVHQLFGIMFQSKQTPPMVRIQPQHSPTSPEEWREHWQAKGFPWRTEAEIDAKRQEELSKRRAIVPDIEKGIYPFKGIKLSRADVEWLLATHENGRGPVNWSDENQQMRGGLDLRGTVVQKTNLNGLPLTFLRGGLESDEWLKATPDQREMAAMHLEDTNLIRTDLRKAILGGAHLEKTYLKGVHLEDATLCGAHLEEACLWEAQLQRSNLMQSCLQGATIAKCVYYPKQSSAIHTIGRTQPWAVRIAGTPKHANQSRNTFSPREAGEYEDSSAVTATPSRWPYKSPA